MPEVQLPGRASVGTPGHGHVAGEGGGGGGAVRVLRPTASTDHRHVSEDISRRLQPPSVNPPADESPQLSPNIMEQRKAILLCPV